MPVEPARGPILVQRLLIIIFCFVLLLIPHAQAVELFAGGNISLNSPVDDDVFAAGDSLTINAPVESVVFAGGELVVNAPVSGDILAAGGRITVNAAVEGKIVAAGGAIEMNGTAKNLVAAGGEITIQPTAVITRDAVISGQRVVNAGTVSRNLTVRAQEFENTGSAGRVDYQEPEGLDALHEVMSILRILMILGFLVLGIVLLKLFPAQFMGVVAEVRRSPLRNTAVGLGLIIVSAIAIFVLAITVVGFPLAAVMGMLFIIALMLSGIFVSFALGKTLSDALTVKLNDLLIFLIGFVILALLFHIPVAGMLIGFVALSLGFGSIVYAVHNNWQRITAPRP
ncbi:MAG: hypothetical protein JW945_08060 [Methanomicrobia archaeon]|nr:hypothetical protein [Methanomicrobia archaeon]